MADTPSGKFARCLAHVFKWEAGYVNDPLDPGGATRYGISKRAYPGEDIENLTKARAAELYERDYWRLIQGDALPTEIAMCVFDAAVNSGVRRSILWLQEAMHLPMDGKIGPQTLSECLARDPAVTAQDHCRVRLNYLRGLSTWPRFGRGWERRVGDTLAEATR